MDALIASYGDASSDSESDTPHPTTTTTTTTTTTIKCEPISSRQAETLSIPPPPSPSFLSPPNFMGAVADYLQTGHPARVRSFPHVEGNYALHVYIPVYIPLMFKKEIVIFLKKMSALVLSLHVVDADVPINTLCMDDHKFEQIALGREFHVSLGRTVPIRVHQIDSVVAMLRQRLQFQKPFWIDFSKWVVFVNDDQTRTFLSIEILMGGLTEIARQIQSVNEVYKLHNLPEFYKDPRPHISLAWALGDISDSLKSAVETETKSSGIGGSVRKNVFTCKFSGIECKIGKKTYKVCKFLDE